MPWALVTLMLGTCYASLATFISCLHIYYQFRADRARRTLRGIDEQVAKSAKAVAGLAVVKRNRFIMLEGAAKTINRELEAKARDLAGLKGYVTKLAACPDGTPVTADFVIDSYQELWNIEIGHRWHRSSRGAFSRLFSCVVGFVCGRRPAGAGVEAWRACPALA